MGAEDLRYGIKLPMTRQHCRGILPTSACEIFRGRALSDADVFSTGDAEFGLDYIYHREVGQTDEMAILFSTPIACV